MSLVSGLVDMRQVKEPATRPMNGIVLAHLWTLFLVGAAVALIEIT